MRRRTFLLSALGAAGALVVGWGLLPPRSRLGDAARLPAIEGQVALNGWLKIDADGGASLAMPRAEMGQGVHTALPMLVAEELDLPLARLRIAPAPFDAIYGNVAGVVALLPLHPLERDGALARGAEWLGAKVGRELGIILTGSSTSVADAWDALRLAGASARAALVGAAARRWNVPAEACRTLEGRVLHGATQSAHYGELAREAAELAPQRIVLKRPADWRLIGTPAPRLDVPGKVNGSAVFGIDLRLPQMLHAAVRMCPELGGGLGALETHAARTLPGVRDVVELPAAAGASAGFAVLADSWWQAERAAAAVEARWTPGPNAALDDRRVMAQLRAAVEQEGGFTFHRRGDVEAAFAAASRRLEAWYQAPYLAHAPMEPMNCTARVSAEGVEVWAPTQVPSFARSAAAQAAGVAEDRVRLHVTQLGGGFGRRLETDVIVQAVHVAQRSGGRPVKLVWSREEDMTHDFYRPAHVARLEAAIDRAGRLSGLRARVAGDRIAPRWGARVYPLLSLDLPDRTAADGLYTLPYGIAHQRMQHVATDMGVPVGNWRSVGYSHNAFFAECFIDEIAHALGQDPVAFRLAQLGAAPRYAAVLKHAAERAAWGTPLAAGRARGVALVGSFGSVVAQVAEVSLDDHGKPRVHRVVCAIDCGVAVNPGIVAQQMEGGIVFGLTAALHGRIDIRAGRVQQRNYPDYPLLGLAATPEIETHVVPSRAAPSGVGEPGVPPIAPAVANALFALTGKRLRSLPFDR
ncbi:MAG TPA: molybdopterin cofactor-binding domain-containing protein [Burkholderiales bacterium]|nr:molybdopterin cofactor-binding domain-containing protein [Burkholderiales bacterium]